MSTFSNVSLCLWSVDGTFIIDCLEKNRCILLYEDNRTNGLNTALNNICSHVLLSLFSLEPELLSN